MSSALVVAMVALVGVIAGQLVALYRGDRSDRQARQSEHMAMMRWAAEQAVSLEPAKADLGVTVLATLRTLENVGRDNQLLIGAVMRSVVASVAAAYETGDDVVLDDSDPEVGNTPRPPYTEHRTEEEVTDDRDERDPGVTRHPGAGPGREGVAGDG